MRTAVILMHDGTRKTEDVPPAQAYDTMFTGSGSVANFWRVRRTPAVVAGGCSSVEASRVDGDRINVERRSHPLEVASE